MIRITYQKNNGEIIQRIRNTLTTYRVGDTTSMGWKVLNIEYRYKDKYYPKTIYDEKVDRSLSIIKKQNKFRKTFYTIYKELIYCIVLLMFIRLYEIMARVNM